MTFEKRAWVVLDAIVLLLVLLSLRLVYWQLVRGESLLPINLAPDELTVLAAERQTPIAGDQELDQLDLRGLAEINLQDLPQPLVQRLVDLLGSVRRGSIYDRSGRLLVEDRPDKAGNRDRFYTEPSLAHLIGSVSGLGIGITGVERDYNDSLLGLDRPDAQLARLVHDPILGSDLILTIDTRLQRAAEEALNGRAGSVTILDGHSGAILAMASLPRFDPNRVLEPGYLSGLVESCQGQPQCSGVLLNRATQALYTPGSTFKTVTLIAALDSAQVKPDAVFDFGKPLQGPNGPYYVYRVGGGVIPDPNHKEDHLNLEMSYAKSANAAFARLGDEMPPEVFISYARRLGFSAPEKVFPLQLDYVPSQLANDVNSLYDNDLLRAATAIGQGELQTTPLNMGMVVLSVINDGVLPLPYVVQSVRSPSGEQIVSAPGSGQVRGLMKPDTARTVREMMIAAVKEGSGGNAGVPGLVVGGKTGTAQLGGDQEPHAWFTGFAEQGDRAVVIVVMVENGGAGSQVAAPIFAKLAALAFDLEQPIEPATPLPPKPTAQPSPTSPPPTATPAPTQAGPTAPAPAPTSAYPGVPPPDIPYTPGKVDFTEIGAQSCPGNKTGPVGSGKFIWPTVYQGLSGTDFKEGHPGIDLSAPNGTPVYAADAGLVIFAGWSGAAGYGNAVVIDHGNGYKTLYAHLSQVSVYCGAKVKSGQVIGLSGSTGNSTGPHLHFEVRVPGGYLNPLKVLPVP